MFRATFLGHHGWLFSGAEASLLVDPLLGDRFGPPEGGGRVFPPRRLELGRFPHVNAVLLTQESEDHFDLASLACLERSIPVFLPRSASPAARRILDDMGFEVRPVTGDETLVVGDLDVLLFGADETSNGTETMDLRQYCVRDTTRHGGFITRVDGLLRRSPEAALSWLDGGSMLWCHPNNLLDLGATQGPPETSRRGPLDSLTLASQVFREQELLRLSGQVPAASLFCGGGVSFDDDREWLNRNAFRADPLQVCRALESVRPTETFVAPLPGQSLVMERGRLLAIETSSPFARALDTEHWPVRTFVGDVPELTSFAPASRRVDLDAADTEALARRLPLLATQWERSAIGPVLASIEGTAIPGSHSVFALALRAGAARDVMIYEYRPGTRTFVRSHRGLAPEAYACGLECWATDLLGLLRGELSPSSVAFGRSRTWAHPSLRLGLDTRLLIDAFLPKHHPQASIALYRRAWQAAEPVPASIRGPRGAHLPRPPGSTQEGQESTPPVL